MLRACFMSCCVSSDEPPGQYNKYVGSTHSHKWGNISVPNSLTIQLHKNVYFFFFLSTLSHCKHSKYPNWTLWSRHHSFTQNNTKPHWQLLLGDLTTRHIWTFFWMTDIPKAKALVGKKEKSNNHKQIHCGHDSFKRGHLLTHPSIYAVLCCAAPTTTPSKHPCNTRGGARLGNG